MLPSYPVLTGGRTWGLDIIGQEHNIDCCKPRAYYQNDRWLIIRANTYAAVAANISTFLALVTETSASAKVAQNTTVSPRRMPLDFT